MSKIELDKIRPANLVIQREFGLVEQNGLRESFALYTVNSSQLSNWAEIEAARSHPEVATLFARAEKLAKRMTNKAHTAALAKLEARLSQ
jgi:hypothetical protein